MSNMDRIVIDITPAIKDWAEKFHRQIVKRATSTYEECRDNREPNDSAELNRRDIDNLVQSFQLLGGFSLEFDGEWRMILVQPSERVPHSICAFVQLMTKYFPGVHKEPIEISWCARGGVGAVAIFQGYMEESRDNLSGYLSRKLTESIRVRKLVSSALPQLLGEEAEALRIEMVELLIEVRTKPLRDLKADSLFQLGVEEMENEMRQHPLLSKLFKD
jgi:hypothetical protein